MSFLFVLVLEYNEIFSKKKAVELRSHAMRTGGGSPKKESLTEWAQRILTIIGKTAVQGNDSVCIPFCLNSYIL